MSKVIAVAHPGQSREVWVGLGQLVWKEFLRAFPPRPGGSLEAEARLRGLL